MFYYPTHSPLDPKRESDPVSPPSEQQNLQGSGVTMAQNSGSPHHQQMGAEARAQVSKKKQKELIRSGECPKIKIKRSRIKDDIFSRRGGGKLKLISPTQAAVQRAKAALLKSNKNKEV